MPKAQNLQEEQWKISISDEWMDKLLMYDFNSSKYSTLSDACLQRRKAGDSAA
jgi:hypothetical protein